MVHGHSSFSSRFEIRGGGAREGETGGGEEKKDEDRMAIDRCHCHCRLHSTMTMVEV